MDPINAILLVILLLCCSDIVWVVKEVIREKMAQRNKLVPEDVKEAAKQVHRLSSRSGRGRSTSMRRDAYADGMLAERERLMSGALCGHVDMCGVSAWVELPSKVLTDYLRSNFKEGDEVRVIIIKKEE